MLKNLKNQISNRKKYNNPNTNSSLINQNLNGVKQSPLEIINEINADVSKESFNETYTIANKLNKNPESSESKAINEAGININSQNLNQQKIQNQILNVEAENKNENLNVVNSNENGFENAAFDDYNLIRKNNNNNSKSVDNSTLNMMRNYNSENIESLNNNQKLGNLNNQLNNNNNNGKEDMHMNYSSYQGYRSNQPMQTRVKKPQGAKEERWKNIKITNIIAERVLLSNQEGNYKKLKLYIKKVLFNK